MIFYTSILRRCLAQVATRPIHRPVQPSTIDHSSSTGAAIRALPGTAASLRPIMNRPRNRQPRASTNGQKQNTHGSSGMSRASPRVAYPDHVPSIHNVVPGASVAIVMKQDQPTGRLVHGQVENVLTRGNHPRGIKVRLSDGRVGRVQSMVAEHSRTNANANETTAGRVLEPDTSTHAPPPVRSLADYLPEAVQPVQSAQDSPAPGYTLTKCPICNNFEGDEIAVSRHVDSHFQPDQR